MIEEPFKRRIVSVVAAFAVTTSLIILVSASKVIDFNEAFTPSSTARRTGSKVPEQNNHLAQPQTSPESSPIVSREQPASPVSPPTRIRLKLLSGNMVLADGSKRTALFEAVDPASILVDHRRYLTNLRVSAEVRISESADRLTYSFLRVSGVNEFREQREYDVSGSLIADDGRDGLPGVAVAKPRFLLNVSEEALRAFNQQPATNGDSTTTNQKAASYTDYGQWEGFDAVLETELGKEGVGEIRFK